MEKKEEKKKSTNKKPQNFRQQQQTKQNKTKCPFDIYVALVKQTNTNKKGFHLVVSMYEVDNI